MPDEPNDLFRRYYAEKLWDLIPPVYRHEDGIAEKPGVLRAFVEVLAGQAAIVRRSNDRAWDDQFIDLCDDWAVPYLGDLVGTRMVSALDLRGRRADVANTIYYRRRAGTLAVLEGLIADITGWEGTVVEAFRRLVRHPHGLDPAPARTGTFTGTPAYGLPDLRQPRGSELVWGPWDEFHHLPDMRRNVGGLDGRYGITKLAFHLFRLLAFRVVRSTPRALLPDTNGNVRFTFDPSGRTIPLFQRHSRPPFDFEWRAALEWELPIPMRCEVLANAAFVVTEANILDWLADSVVTQAQAETLRSIRGLRLPSEGRFRARLAALFAAPLGLAAMHRLLADSLSADCGKGVLLPPATVGSGGDISSISVEEVVAGVLTPIARERIVAGNLSVGAVTPDDKLLVIDAENGLGYPTATSPAGLMLTWLYGFSGDIGAGSANRAGLPVVPMAGQVQGGGSLGPPAVAADAALEIADSTTYSPVKNISVQNSTLVQAANEQRPYLDLAADWKITATAAASALVLDGLWVGARGPRTIHLAATATSAWSTVTLRHVTFDPGGADADGGAIGPIVLSVESTITDLTIDSSILGRIVVGAGGFIEHLTIRRSIVQTTDPAVHPVAIAQPHGDLDIRGCTVLGQMAVHRIDASELLCTGSIVVDDVQSGCVRFSAFGPASQVPRPYRTQTLDDPHSLFTSTRFGDPGYGQLSDRAPDEILRGGDDGTEIGAFTSLLTTIKLDSLRTKVDEFLPFGLIPHFITET